MPSDPTPDEKANSHRWHAMECNNLGWSLSEKPQRTKEENVEMLHAAHASAFHWAKVGTELHAARAKMLLGHVYAALGHGDLAMAYAKESFDYFVAHDPPDWELAFTHAILAHATYAAGIADLHSQHYQEAEELGRAITDTEDKVIFFKTFAGIPKP